MTLMLSSEKIGGYSIPFKESHPTLFLIATDPETVVASNREGNIWDKHFRRNLQDGEFGELFALCNLQEGCSVKSQIVSNGITQAKEIRPSR